MGMTNMTLATKARRTMTLGLLALGLVTTTGCATVQPYERAKLAHPTMSAADLAGPGEEHLRAVQEGAVGGGTGAGSGCGCN
ncbi:MAG: DUF4266 domain-containing protein [Deltaproteobacteria bacterium]|nr:DUF4266 domain-containing protein [Deltaproteobacteria bacterium]